MANTFIQAVQQTQEASLSYERVIVQYIDDNETQGQVLVNYDLLSNEEKLIYDNFKNFCKSKIPT